LPLTFNPVETVTWDVKVSAPLKVWVAIRTATPCPWRVTLEDRAENGLDALIVTPSPEAEDPPPLEVPQETPKQTGVPNPVVWALA